MKNILRLFKINTYTYLFLGVCYLIGFIKQALIIFIIVIIHELGHIIVSKLYKYDIIKVYIYPFGGMTISNKKLNCSINKSIVIYLGGILSQLIILFLIILLHKHHLISNIFYPLFLFYNKYIILFNLLPVFPLDGFFIIFHMVQKFLSFYYTYIVMGVMNVIFLIIFFIYNINIKSNNYLILIFLIYQLFNYYKILNNIFNRFLLERYLFDFNYKKIKYHNSLNLKELQNCCYHYFKGDTFFYNEKDLLAKKFDINRRF